MTDSDDVELDELEDEAQPEVTVGGAVVQQQQQQLREFQAALAESSKIMRMVTSQHEELLLTRQDVMHARAQHSAAVTENGKLRRRLEKAKSIIAKLRAELEEANVETTVDDAAAELEEGDEEPAVEPVGVQSNGDEQVAEPATPT